VSGNKNNKTHYTEKDITVGVEWAKNFFLDLLRHNTYEEKVSFLEGVNAFSLIPDEKDPAPIKSTFDFMRSKVSSVLQCQENNLGSLHAFSEEALASARKKFEQSKTNSLGGK